MARTIRNKNFLPPWVFIDVDAVVFDDGEVIVCLYKIFQEDLPEAISKHHRDKYKPGRRNKQPKALRQYAGKKYRLKTRAEMLKVFGDVDYPVDYSTKPVLPYWD